MVLFGLSSHIGVSLICSSAPKIPHYYAHFRSENFVGKKNAQIQGKSAVHPVGLTSILTQYMGIFLRQNRVRMCALWLKIRFCQSGVKQLIIDSADKHLSLEVPKNIDVSLHTTSADIKANSLEQKSLLVSAHSGNTELGTVTVDSADLSSSSGNVSAKSMAAKTLKCAVTSGSVSFESISANEINCATTSGNVDMYRVSAEKASLATTSGKIDYAPKSVQNTDISSTSGSVDLKVPSNGAELSFASISGKLRTDLSYGRKGDLYVFGNGQSSVSVSTTSGDVTVK